VVAGRGFREGILVSDHPGGDSPAAVDSPAAGGAPAPPPDPDKYDSPRAEQARRRGLDAPYIAGGEDPDPEAGRREERHYLRILVVMIVIVVLSGFVLGYLQQLLAG
jgi:hypothetical protein